MKRFLPLILFFTSFVLSSCATFEYENYSEPQPTDKVAKVTFVRSTNFNSVTTDYSDIFSIRKTEGNYLRYTQTTITFDRKTRDRNFGIPTPSNSKTLYNIYIPANKTFKFDASISHDWYSDLSNTSGKENRASLCNYNNIEFTPVEGGEYLVFIDNTRDNIKNAPRCSLNIKQFVKNSSGNQWVDVQFKFNNDGRDVMFTYERKN
ncbi:MAG: hypothetical protein J6563_03715 [Gilliamella sp.]|uniref:hypothetical protein n=1 Tax=Gilliamella sp. TaxID=1891236 RepID=UPI00261B8D43|nr:hypothetical protein [Gilliamella sp.]MCO6552062.1 hypothetical protein [Gilliamella sp.]